MPGFLHSKADSGGQRLLAKYHFVGVDFHSKNSHASRHRFHGRMSRRYSHVTFHLASDQNVAPPPALMHSHAFPVSSQSNHFNSGRMFDGRLARVGLVVGLVRLRGRPAARRLRRFLVRVPRGHARRRAR